VGLRPVKEELSMLVGRLRLEQHYRHQARLTLGPLFFLGPPGTGKTTVARLLGRILHSLGLLRTGHVIKVTRSDLVAGYIGRTAEKTRDAMRAAVDGVLFIDEAYSLAPRRDQLDFGYEAIDTLLEEMEKWRERVLVVAAGAPEPMKEFLASTPGLQRRSTHPITFHAYSLPELVQIFHRLAAAEGYELEPATEARAAAWLTAERSAHPGDFDNAGAVRRLLEVMAARLATRSQPSIADAATIKIFKPEDVPAVRG
jgi:AAA+ superfamily predicted ATPase